MDVDRRMKKDRYNLLDINIYKTEPERGTGHK